MNDTDATTSKPVPDPTILTTEAMARLVAERGVLVDAQLDKRDAQITAHSAMVDQQITGLRETLLAVIEGSKAQIDERLNGMDRASVVLADNVNRVPTNLQVAVQNAQQFNDVKFSALNDILSVLRDELTSRFELLDKQTVREKAAADLAVNAAFAAADKVGVAAAIASDKAIDKSEKATSETIKTNEQARVAGNQAMSDKIDDDRARMSRMEQQIITLQTQRVTVNETKTDNRVLITVVIGGIALFVAILVAGITIYAALKP